MIIMRKYFLLLLIVLFVFPALAQEKKEITLETEASEVTVFIKGAQVTRKKSNNLPAGKSTIRFTKLSPNIDASSIRVKMDGRVMILSVNQEINYEDVLQQSEKQDELNNTILELNEKQQLEKVKKNIIKEEIDFLQENKKIGGTQEGVTATNLKASATYYTERIKGLYMQQLEIDKVIEKNNTELRKAQLQLNQLGGKKENPMGEIVVEVECPSALISVPIEVSYFVKDASWYPSYDIKASTISEPIEIVYKANIMQTTQENWKNIKLKVSSANPNLGNVAPQLKTYFLNYYTAPPRYNVNVEDNTITGRVMETSTREPLIGAGVRVQGTTIATATDIDGNFSLTRPTSGENLEISYIGFKTKILPISSSFMNIYMDEDQVLLDEVVIVGYGVEKQLEGKLTGSAGGGKQKPISKPDNAPIPLPVTIVENQTAVEFEVKRPYTISSENKNTVVELASYSVPAKFEYYSIPKIDKDAFLLANIYDWEQYNLLEGEANIFFENTYVGKTLLDLRQTTDTLNISLGRDKNISVQREKVQDFSAKKNIFGSKKEETRHWKITVKNNKKQSISFVLLDQIPVSTIKEIEVNTEKLSEGILNEENGQVKWNLTIPSATSKEVELLYKVKYPSGQSLHIE